MRPDESQQREGTEAGKLFRAAVIRVLERVRQADADGYAVLEPDDVLRQALNRPWYDYWLAQKPQHLRIQDWRRSSSRGYDAEIGKIDRAFPRKRSAGS